MDWNMNTQGNNRNYSNIPGNKNGMGGNVNPQGNNGTFSDIPGDKNGIGGNKNSLGNETNHLPLFNTNGCPSVHFESNYVNHRGIDN